MKHLKGNLYLTFTAFIWGIAFVAQSVGMDYVGPFTFNCVRSFIGGIVLIPAIFFLKKLHFIEETPSSSPKLLIIGGICCGIALGIASTIQQIGIKYTSPGKAGFITALYIVIVPIIGIFFKKKPSLKLWISVIIALIGMYLLCITEKFTIGSGDICVLISAFAFSIQILAVDYFSPRVEGVKLACIQFFVAGSVAGIGMILFESPNLSSIFAAAIPILYAGIFSSGLGYTFQIIGQKYTSPTEASLLMSLESVFSLLGSFIILHEVLSSKELIGCALVFAAIILTQIPTKKGSN